MPCISQEVMMVGEHRLTVQLREMSVEFVPHLLLIYDLDS